eukprot:GCRY01000590.1.p1 GENE.GCRY01000590.1~~GCRY01000590.1.p1  ORF type:complete len:622 (-),score=212.69 GCRY01000590.1:57-1922(-)
MVRKKKQSKRTTLKDKYKVIKKVKEHQRKLKKDQKKNPNLRKKVSKDPGIPNLAPFKEKLMADIERAKEAAKEDKVKRVQQAKQMKKVRNLAEMSANIRERTKQFEEKQKQEVGQNLDSHKDHSKKQFFRDLKKVAEVSDVLLEVLDARDPLGCRCFDVEKWVLQRDPTKKIILILNKVDLVPREIIEVWLNYLRRDFPCIAFKSSTQNQRSKISQSAVSIENATQDQLSTSDCLGADTLLSLLKNYCRNKNIKTAISVGLFGYPNVGKSSVINSLKRSRAAGVGATPGFTTGVQEVHLDKHIKLLDTPGIVFAPGASVDSNVILRNCVKVEQIDDPVGPVALIVARCQKDRLMQLYNVPNFSDVTEFIAHVARSRGKLRKGGLPNMDAAAKLILQDWNKGTIPFYTVPPKEKTSAGVVSSSVVTSYSEDFDMQQIIDKEKDLVIEHLPSVKASTNTFMIMAAGKSERLNMDSDSESESESDDGMEEEGEEEEEEGVDSEAEEEMDRMAMKQGTHMIAGHSAAEKRRRQRERDEAKSKPILSAAEEAGNLQVNQDKKKRLKKQQREKRKHRFEGNEEEEGFDFQNDFVADDSDSDTDSDVADIRDILARRGQESDSDSDSD